MNIDWQVETIRAFVIPQKRERYVEAVSSEKRRRKFIAKLSHFADFDPRWIVPITPSTQYPGGIRSMLTNRGAQKTCRAISELGKLDCQEIALEDALEQIIGNGMGTILCCVPGRLAYFESEETRFILERAN